MSEPDPILTALAELPEHDVDDWRRENIRHRAHRALNADREPWHRRWLAPASVYGFGVVYLAWAFGQVATIYGG